MMSMYHYSNGTRTGLSLQLHDAVCFIYTYVLGTFRFDVGNDCVRALDVLNMDPPVSPNCHNAETCHHGKAWPPLFSTILLSLRCRWLRCSATIHPLVRMSHGTACVFSASLPRRRRSMMKSPVLTAEKYRRIQRSALVLDISVKAMAASRGPIDNVRSAPDGCLSARGSHP